METILGIDLNTWWFLVLGAVISGYAILDGFDLGAGASNLFFNKELSRRVALNAVGPVWDGNEVWLVIGGGAIFAGFPKMYASLLSGMYEFFMILFVGLIWRAVAIEFRSKEPMIWWRKMWDVVYTFSSASIALTLGLILGNVIKGVPMDAQGNFTGSFTQLLNPYAIVVSITTLALFMLHGAVYLALKTEGRLYTKLTIMIRRYVRFFIISFTVLSFASLVYVPFIIERFKKYPVMFLLPAVTFIAIYFISIYIQKQKYRQAFVSSIVTIASIFGLVAVSIFPNLLFNTTAGVVNLTIYNSASSPNTLRTLLLIAAIGTPLVAAYTIFVFYTFKGKVIIDETSY